MNAVSCASPRFCAAVGEGRTVLMTVNGRSWRLIKPDAALRKAADLGEVRCPVVKFCVIAAYPNIVLRTANGGTTWASTRLSLPLGDGLSNLACPTRLVCYVTATPSGSPPTWSHAAAAILTTTNGGRDWVAQKIPKRVENTAQSGRSGYSLTWISCVSATTCRAGSEAFLDSHDGYVEIVLSTTDGGRHWSVVNSSSSANIVTCPTRSVCDAVYYDPGSVDPGPTLMRSTDGGRTWRQASIKTPYDSIACAGPDFCELAGPSGRLAEDLDNVIHAQKSPLKPATTHGVYGVACPSRLLCYAVGFDGRILRYLRRIVDDPTY